MIYLTGARLRPSERLGAFVLPQEGPPHFVVPGFEAASLPALPAGTHVHTWGESESPAHLIASIIAGGLTSAPGGANCTIGIAERLWSVFLLRLQAELPRAAFTPATVVLSGARQIKDPEEIGRMQEAGAHADKAFADLVMIPFIDRSEIEVSHDYAQILEDHGLSVPDLPIVASGPNGASPHHHAGGRIIEPGDAIVLDFSGTWQDYGFDCTRTVFAGDPPAPDSEEARVYAIVAQAQEAGVQAAEPGLECQALDTVARDIITKAGYGQYFTHRLGHGIGLDIHEPPYLVQGNSTPLQNGMVFSVEPGIYIPGRFGVRIEDLVAIVDNKAVRLNNSDHVIVTVN
jgi:Xaa-Pro aminopeptidase